MTRDEIVQDLAYVRTLAEEGRHAPLIGGAFLVLFGLLLGGCYALQWAFMTGFVDDFGGSAYGWLWIAYTIGAIVGVWWLALRMRRKPGTASIVNKVDRVIWRISGLAIGVVAIACIVRMVMFQDWEAPAAIMAAAFVLFAVPLGTTAVISNQGWLFWFAGLSFAASCVFWVFMAEPWTYLLGAVASVVVLALPGFLMIRREPSDVV